MGKGGGGSERYVVDYHMGIHYGICHGPVDALLNIIIKEKDAWPGQTLYPEPEDDPDAPVVDDVSIKLLKDFIDEATGGVSEYTGNAQLPVLVAAQSFPIKRPTLFGGDEKEGGLDGLAHWMPGHQDQTLTDFLAAKLGLTAATAPGFRGIACCWFSWYDASKGFLWAQNNPYMPTAWFRVFRRPKGLSAIEATIQDGDNPPDANPAHIIYEALTDTTWGMGAASSSIDVPSFIACGQALIAEKFGMSLGWYEQSSIEDFIKEIIDHIQAVLFVKPETGLLTLKLIRPDYDFATLERYGPDNCVALSRQRKGWGDTINEIVVTFTNWRTEREETVTLHNRGNMNIQGGIVSDSRNYYGVRNANLAGQIGSRDLASVSYPLFAAELEVDRTAWKKHPGDVIVFEWPEDGLVGVVLRVMNVDYGKLGDPKIKISLLEDIWATPSAEWISPPSTQWENPTTIPKPVPPADAKPVVLPASAVAVLAATPLLTDADYPNTVVGILAAKPSADSIDFELVGRGFLPNGQPRDVNLGTMNFTDFNRTGGVWPRQAQTTIPKASLSYTGIGNGQPQRGDFGYLGDDDQGEIVMFDNEAGSNWIIARGMFDTVPKEWPAGTRIWIVGPGFDSFDDTLRAAGAPVSYRLRTRTPAGLLPMTLATEIFITPTDRPYRPYRPANVKVDTLAFPESIDYSTAPTSIAVTWANRNRLTEDTIAKRWAEGNVAGEAGQTTEIVFSTIDDVEIHRITGLSGTSTSINYATLVAALGGVGEAVLKVVSKRDGFESIQGLEFLLQFTDAEYGYGYGYGYDYGGS